MRVGVLASGDGSNLQAILDRVHGREGVEVVAVGSDRPEARALERAGHAVRVCADGEEAVEALNDGPYDLLLTDIVMPEMDGIELAQKASAIDPEIRVMFITGFSAVTLKAGRAVPNAKVLSKPFHLRDLVMEVDRVFATEAASGLN